MPSIRECAARGIAWGCGGDAHHCGGVLKIGARCRGDLAFARRLAADAAVGAWIGGVERDVLALLGEGPTTRHLTLLQGALAEQREATGDFGLDDTLNWAEVRVAVEAAKLERANEPA